MRRHDSHPLDPFSLVSGIVFLAAAVLFILGAYVDLNINARAAWAALLIALGAGGLLTAVASSRRQRPVEESDES